MMAPPGSEVHAAGICVGGGRAFVVESSVITASRLPDRSARRSVVSGTVPERRQRGQLSGSVAEVPQPVRQWRAGLARHLALHVDAPPGQGRRSAGDQIGGPPPLDPARPVILELPLDRRRFSCIAELVSRGGFDRVVLAFGGVGSGDRLGHLPHFAVVFRHVWFGPILDAHLLVRSCLLLRVDVHGVVSIPVVVSGSSTGGVNQRPTVEGCTCNSSAIALFDQPASRSRAARSRRPSTRSASGSASGSASASDARSASATAGSSGGA